MILTVYAQAADPHFMQLWVGMFGTESPPAPQFLIDREVVAPVNTTGMTPIRDNHVGLGGQPLNYRGLYRFEIADAGLPHLVEVRAGAERRELAPSRVRGVECLHP